MGRDATQARPYHDASVATYSTLDSRNRSAMMRSMNSRTALRFLVIAHVLLMVLGVGLSFFDEHLLPKELAEWKADNSLGDDLTWTEFLIFASWSMWMLLYLVACVGLLFLKRWAAFMMLVLAILGFGFTLTEPNVSSGLLAALSDASMLFMGAILAVAFASEALQERTHGA